MKNQTEIETTIQERLNELRSVPERDPRAASRGRARFLSQAVSASEYQRHKGWKLFPRKEQFAMNLLISIVVVAGLLFGGGVTVQAAQDDLPNEPLYGLKTWSEELSLRFQGDPEARVERLMELIQTRTQEMERLTEAGQTPPDQVRLRLETHLQQALQICSNMDDPALDRTLLQLRDQLRQHDRQMQHLQELASPDAQPILARTRTTLQTRLQLVDGGLVDHEMFRNTIRNGFNYGQTQTPPPDLTSTPPAPTGQQNQNGQPTQAGPDNGSGPGPNTDPGGPNPGATSMPDNGGGGSGSGGSSGGGSEGGKSSGDDGSGSDKSSGSGSGGGGNGP